nr:transporter substrate-binding domain-containing protein [Roseibium denhamense]
MVVLVSGKIAAMVFAIFWAIGPASASEPSGTCETVRLTGSPTWFPVSMATEDRQSLEGVMPVLAHQIFGELGVAVMELTDLPWRRSLTLLEAGEVDVLAGAFSTRQREKEYVLSHPVIREEIGIFIRRDTPAQPQSLNDLIGLRGLAPFGSSFGEEFDVFAGDNLAIHRESFDDNLENMQLLLEGKADYFVIARREGDRMIAQLEAEDAVMVAPWSAIENTIHFMFSKKSACVNLLEDFNAALEAHIADGTVASMILDHDSHAQLTD